jgi:predicted house-cleaning noncanonical NTP pyrophosphatase (MazG superfamily)
MRTHYDKLIRDRVPSIMDDAGVRYGVQRLDDVDYRAALRAKLVEEATEAARTTDRDSLLQELADLSEVMRYLASAEAIRHDEIEAERLERERTRGAFQERLRLLWTEPGETGDP